MNNNFFVLLENWKNGKMEQARNQRPNIPTFHFIQDQSSQGVIQLFLSYSL
jgi:hypothetical protein